MTLFVGCDLSSPSWGLLGAPCPSSPKCADLLRAAFSATSSFILFDGGGGLALTNLDGCNGEAGATDDVGDSAYDFFNADFRLTAGGEAVDELGDAIWSLLLSQHWVVTWGGDDRFTLGLSAMFWPIMDAFNSPFPRGNLRKYES